MHDKHDITPLVKEIRYQKKHRKSKSKKKRFTSGIQSFIIFPLFIDLTFKGKKNEIHDHFLKLKKYPSFFLQGRGDLKFIQETKTQTKGGPGQIFRIVGKIFHQNRFCFSHFVELRAFFLTPAKKCSWAFHEFYAHSDDFY